MYPPYWLSSKEGTYHPPRRGLLLNYATGKTLFRRKICLHEWSIIIFETSLKLQTKIEN